MYLHVWKISPWWNAQISWKTHRFYNNVSLASQNKILIPPIRILDRYASSQIYTFSKTKLVCRFTRSALFWTQDSRKSNQCDFCIKTEPWSTVWGNVECLLHRLPLRMFSCFSHSDKDRLQFPYFCLLKAHICTTETYHFPEFTDVFQLLLRCIFDWTPRSKIIQVKPSPRRE